MTKHFVPLETNEKTKELDDAQEGLGTPDKLVQNKTELEPWN